MLRKPLSGRLKLNHIGFDEKLLSQLGISMQDLFKICDGPGIVI